MPATKKNRIARTIAFVVSGVAILAATTELSQNIEYIIEKLSPAKPSGDVSYAYEDMLIGRMQDEPTLLRMRVLVNNSSEHPAFAIETLVDIQSIVGERAIGKNTSCYFNLDAPSVGYEVKPKSREMIACDINLYWMEDTEVEVLRDKICNFYIRTYDIELGDRYFDVMTDLHRPGFSGDC